MPVKDSLMTIEDFRIDRCKKLKLVDILMLVFFGLLCGYKSIEEIHFYAELSIDVLKKYLELPNGILSSDTILRVLARLETKELENDLLNMQKRLSETNLKKTMLLPLTVKQNAIHSSVRSREQEEATKLYIWYQHGRQGLESASDR